MESPPQRPPSKRARVQAWLALHAPERIAAPEWEAITADLGDISSGYLRKLLRESGVALAPLVEGVRQEDFASLERTLQALLGEYQAGDGARRQEVRRRVIEAKDHARWAARKPERRAQKEEMVLWMITWLENPALFPQWVRLRRRAHGEQHGAT